jgi:hypothetical protein
MEILKERNFIALVRAQICAQKNLILYFVLFWTMIKQIVIAK